MNEETAKVSAEVASQMHVINKVMVDEKCTMLGLTTGNTKSSKFEPQQAFIGKLRHDKNFIEN